MANHINTERIDALIQQSNILSRDLSWLEFDRRVLDLAQEKDRNLFDRLKFLAITSSNLDEFFMIRVGSLYNYLDYGKSRIDYSGLREELLHIKLYQELHAFLRQQQQTFLQELLPLLPEHGLRICGPAALHAHEREQLNLYFKKTVFPTLTPMSYDSYHTFPILLNQLLIFGIVTLDKPEDGKPRRKLSFVQIPKNLPRFLEVEREDERLFVPMEELIREHLDKLFRNVQIESTSLFRITRNGEYTLEESEDLEVDFVHELKRQLQTRKTGRVLRIEIEPGYSPWMAEILCERWNLREVNFFPVQGLIDYTGLWQIIRHREFRSQLPASKQPVQPLSIDDPEQDMFSLLQQRDVLLHHPYNSAEHMLRLLEAAAEDPNVFSIKMTIYRLAKESRVTRALLRAAESGKHVSVLFEVKARFDEENNIREAKRLQDAGCFVIYGISALKTHTKLMLIVRKEGEGVGRYVHMSSGNYNEDTARLYTDVSLMSTNEAYAEDVSEFFNAITGHSLPGQYQLLITAPQEMRLRLISLIEREAEHARAGRPSGIVIKVNSLQDKTFIEALYAASQAGVSIELIVRGICCLRPGRTGLSEHIRVRSIVGDYLEHTRLLYFQNGGTPEIYSGSADAMVRSFDRRIESLFQIVDPMAKQEAINILAYNLRDNQNSYLLCEDGSYIKIQPAKGETRFSVFEEFYHVTREIIEQAKLF